MELDHSLEHNVGRVLCHNGWDPLEEVIVGRADGACIPSWNENAKATLPEKHWELFKQRGGQPYPQDEIDAANRNLEDLVTILKSAGVVVHRPTATDFSKPFTTPYWAADSGLYAAMPRDVALVVGDAIIEAPMPWRSRHYEIAAYRAIFGEYFSKGAKWICPPKPLLCDDLYDKAVENDDRANRFSSVLTEKEIVFDAADFIPCGREIYYFHSHTTNRLGAAWLARTLGSDYQVIELDCDDSHRMHIDTTFLPIAPGKMLVNPERVKKKPKQLKNWEFLPAPAPCTPSDVPLYMSGPWLSMNILMLNEQTAIVAEHETNLIRSLEQWGIDVAPCPFVDFYRFGGSVHCATLDIRRRGELRSYL